MARPVLDLGVCLCNGDGKGCPFCMERDRRLCPMRNARAERRYTLNGRSLFLIPPFRLWDQLSLLIFFLSSRVNSKNSRFRDSKAKCCSIWDAEGCYRFQNCAGISRFLLFYPLFFRCPPLSLSLSLSPSLPTFSPPQQRTPSPTHQRTPSYPHITHHTLLLHYSQFQ